MKPLPIVIVCAFLSMQTTLSAHPGNPAVQLKRLKAAAGKLSAAPSSTLLNINNFSMWVSDDGVSGRDPVTLNAGTVYPRGTATCVYTDGLLWGGHVHDGGAQILRVNGSVYQTGVAPGRIISAGVAESPTDSSVRVYRIRRDYATADLQQDAAEYYHKIPSEVTASDIQALRDQYKADWLQWPWQKGAPYYDRNHNGVYDPDSSGAYDPAKDEPGIAGGDQVIWFVMNDLDSTRSLSFLGSEPIGLEIQEAIWGYGSPGRLGNVIFKQYKIIYKGTSTTGPSAAIDSMFVGQWSDPDLGDYTDDFAGCDTALGTGFCYNAVAVDNHYQQFGLPPPSVGYTTLGGPIVPSPGDSAIVDLRYRPGFRNLGLTSWIFFAAGGSAFDPPFSYEGAGQWYHLFRGLQPYDGSPFIYPGSTQATTFWLSGDPVSGTGNLDGVIDAPGDRQMTSASGPFSLAIGDTQEVVFALVGGSGADRLSSVTELRSNALVCRTAYRDLFSIAGPNVVVSPLFVSSSVTRLPITASVAHGTAIAMLASVSTYGGTVLAVDSLRDDGLHGDGAAGDGVFGDTISLPPQRQGVFIDLTVVQAGGSSSTFRHLADNVPLAGPVDIPGASVASDNLNDDGIVNPGENIRYVLTVRNRTMFDLSGITLRVSHDVFGRVISIPPLASDSSYSLRYNASDSLSYFSFDVPGGYADSVYPLVVTIADTNHNQWTDSIAFKVVPFAAPFYVSPMAHSLGRTDWKFKLLVVDPAAVKNHTYELLGVDSIDVTGTRGFTLRDATLNTTLIVDHPLPDQYAHNIPVTDGFKVMRGDPFGTSGFRRDSTGWRPSGGAWLEGSRFTADSIQAFGGGVTTGAELGMNYLGHVASNFDPSLSMPVEIRFDSTHQQKAYRLRRTGATSGYMIQSTSPFTAIPFSAWDVTHPSLPRQLTIAWRDQDNSETWNPQIGNDGLEVIFVYRKSYDSTGSKQFAMPPSAIEDECTAGAKADIVYGLSLALISGHALNEAPGVLYIRPVLALSSGDRFTFNPTIVDFAPEPDRPLTYSLSQNYPNPFNPVTTIQYSIPVESVVRLTIYNLLGQQVKVLQDGPQGPGTRVVQWNGVNDAGRSVSTGVYFYRMEARSASKTTARFVKVQKMLLLR